MTIKDTVLLEQLIEHEINSLTCSIRIQELNIKEVNERKVNAEVSLKSLNLGLKSFESKIKNLRRHLNELRISKK